MRTVLLPLLLAATPTLADYHCHLDTMCKIGGGCRTEGVELDLAITGGPSAPVLAIDGATPLDMAADPLGPSGGWLFFGTRANGSHELLTLAADGTAQLFILYGKRSDFTYRGTCEGTL